MKDFKVVDMFCGAGGFSTATLNVLERLGYDAELIAINHWDVAIATHSKNHLKVKHHCESIETLDPKKVVPGGRLDLMLASPECTHHSVARGGKPINDQSRATAWRLLEWAEKLFIARILIENVPEFQSWGPLGADGRPLKSKKGELFRLFIAGLRALGYRVEYRVINAADHGDPQTRRRLFVQAVRGNLPIKWPEKTHHKRNKIGIVHPSFKPWRAAREIIDWSVPGESIFTRERPLAVNTLTRIEKGLMKFSGPNAWPWLVILRRHMDGAPLDGPVPTVTAGGQHIALCQPFITRYQKGQPVSIDEPLPTQVCKECFALAQPFILAHPQFQYQQELVDSVDDPLRTVTATNGRGNKLIEPVLIRYNGSHSGMDDGNGRVQSVDEPLSSVDCANRFGIVEPFIVPHFGERGGQDPRTHSVDEPLPGVTASKGAGSLVQPFITEVSHGGGHERRVRSIDDPLGTLTAKNNRAIVTPLLILGLGEYVYGIDLLFRMFLAHELAAAQSFPRTYFFMGNKGEVVRQIGNAVPVKLGEALVGAMIS